jgi:hypothetical protein
LPASAGVGVSGKTILISLLCASRLPVVVACAYRSSVILLFACRKDSTLMSSPLAMNSEAMVRLNVCQPIFPEIPAFFAAGWR